MDRVLTPRRFERLRVVQPKPAKSWLETYRDWTAPLFATASLLISAVTAYFAWRTVDDTVAVVVSPSGGEVEGWDGAKYAVPGDVRITFANRGTRPVAVVAYTLIIVKSDENHRLFPCKWSQYSENREVHYGVQIVEAQGTTVVKAGEVTVESVNFENRTNFLQTLSVFEGRSSGFDSQCLSISFITPDGKMKQASMAVDLNDGQYARTLPLRSDLEVDNRIVPRKLSSAEQKANSSFGQGNDF